MGQYMDGDFIIQQIELFITISSMNQMDWIERRYLYILFGLAIATQVFSIALFVLLTVFDYIGFDGKTPITPSCSNYFNSKYSQTTTMIEISYISSIIALITFSIVFGIVIYLVVKICKTQEDTIFVSKCIKISVVILTTIGLISAIIPTAYYLAFLLELGNCSSTYDSTYVIVILAIAAALLILFLLFYILFNVFLNCSSDQKYRQVEHNSTEPQEYVKKPAEKPEAIKRQPENYEKRTPQQLSKASPPKKVGSNRGQEMELTKENIYGSPTRQPITHTYSKQIEPQPVAKPTPTPQRQYQPPKERAPILQHKPNRQYELPLNSRQKLGKEGQLVYESKPRRRVDDDEQDFSKQQSRFMSKYGTRPILSNSSLIEGSRQKRFINGAFNNQQSHNSNVNKYAPEKSLLNRIRGKYVN